MRDKRVDEITRLLIEPSCEECRFYTGVGPLNIECHAEINRPFSVYDELVAAIPINMAGAVSDYASVVFRDACQGKFFEYGVHRDRKRYERK